MDDRDEVAQYSAAVHRRDVGRLIRLIFVAAIIVVIVVVGMDNRDDVRVGYAIGDAQAPVWVVIVIATVVGIVIGWLIRHRPRRRV
jgi:uncharacterized integral membrane protein